MVPTFSNRLWAIWTCVCFAAVSSCHLLCAAEVMACPGAGAEAADCCHQELPCKTCHDSLELTSAVLPAPLLDLALGQTALAVAVGDWQSVFVPERAVAGVLRRVAEDPPVRYLLELRRSCPIRAPTVE